MYKIVETLADGTVRNRGVWEAEEYDALMEAWTDYLDIAGMTHTLVQMYRNGEVRITYDQREK